MLHGVESGAIVSFMLLILLCAVCIALLRAAGAVPYALYIILLSLPPPGM